MEEKKLSKLKTINFEMWASNRWEINVAVCMVVWEEAKWFHHCSSESKGKYLHKQLR